MRHTDEPDCHVAPRGRGDAGPTRSRPRCRRPTVLGLAVTAALALTSCAGSPGGGTTEDTTSPASSETGPATAPATEAATATESAEASTTATATGAPGDGEDTTGGVSATQTHSTEGGYYQWSLPADWTISEELAGPDTTDAYGVKNERWVFQNPDMTAVFSADTGVGPTDDDGAKPDVIEVVDAQQLEGLPSDPGYGEEDTWFRAVILQENGASGDQPFFDGEDYRLAVQVVGVPEGVDPESTGEDYWSGWTYVLPPAEGVQEGTASFLHGHITQSDAEAITGETGGDALRAILDSEEYRELKDVATSMEVTAP
jgi:hypothetical protein